MADSKVKSFKGTAVAMQKEDRCSGAAYIVLPLRSVKSFVRHNAITVARRGTLLPFAKQRNHQPRRSLISPRF